MSGLLHSVGVLLYHLGLARPVRWLNRRVPKVLVYHSCDTEESDFIEGLDSNTTPSNFERHLAYLTRHYRIVPLARLEEGAPDDRTVVITFDDGYRSVYTHAFPLLRARGLAATVYLVGATQANRRLVWVNELNWLLRRHVAQAAPRTAQALGLPERTDIPELIDAARRRLAPDAITRLIEDIACACRIDRGQLARDARLYLETGEMAELAETGFTFGNHTASHADLARLPAPAIREELDNGDTTHLPGGVRSVAYPFGSYNEDVRDAALRAGATTVMQVGGWNRPLDPAAVRRVPVAADSVADLFSRMEVVEPVKETIRRLLRRPAYGYVRPTSPAAERAAP